MEQTKTTKRNSKFELSASRLETLNKTGSVNHLIQLIEKNKINITVEDILDTLPVYISKLRPDQIPIFRGYYLLQSSIFELRKTLRYGYSFNDIERRITSSTNRYIKMLKADYGVREE